MDDPRLDVGELVLHLDHVHVVEDADHALEQRGIAAGERARGVDELLEALGVAARGEEVLHHARRVGLAERRELDDLVAASTVLRPAVAARQHVGARQAEDQDRRIERVDEVLEEVDRLVVREVEVVEDEHDGTAPSRCVRRTGHRRVFLDAADARLGPLAVGSGVAGRDGHVQRIGLEEALDDCAAERAHLGGVAADRLDQRGIEELELEELPKEVTDVADLAILEDRGDLRADLRLRRLAVHALDDAETRAEHARKDVVGGAVIAGGAAKHARRAEITGARLGEKIPDETRLADSARADERDRARSPVVAHGTQRLVEHAQLGRSTDEAGTPVHRSEGGRGKAASLGHGGGS